MTNTPRTLAGTVTSIAGNVLTIELWTDPDTGETLTVDVALPPSIGLSGTAYAQVATDGPTVIGEPYASAGQGVWAYAGTNATVDPGSGGIAINGTGQSPRTFAISTTDADGFVRNLSVVRPGDNVTITDDPLVPPTTGFARYVVTSTPVDHGSWYSFTANRTDTAGTQTPPPVGTRLRASVGAGGSGSGPVGPYPVKFATYQQLIDGITIGG